jgi:predicted transcriptional regulator
MEEPMHLTIHLTPETEARLNEQARLLGQKPEDVVLAAVEEKLAAVDDRESISNEKRIADLEAWLSAHPQSAVRELDDSREGIYEGRGQ